MTGNKLPMGHLLPGPEYSKSLYLQVESFAAQAQNGGSLFTVPPVPVQDFCYIFLFHSPENLVKGSCPGGGQKGKLFFIFPTLLL